MIRSRAHRGDAGRRDHGNSGHFDDEIDIRRCCEHGRRPVARRCATFVEEFNLRMAAHLPAGRGPPDQPGGRRRAPGSGDGHELRQPGARRRVRGEARGKLETEVYVVPEDIDREIARLKLDAMGIEIDTLTPSRSISTLAAGPGDATQRAQKLDVRYSAGTRGASAHRGERSTTAQTPAHRTGS